MAGKKKLIDQLVKVDLLILDDWSLTTPSRPQNHRARYRQPEVIEDGYHVVGYVGFGSFGVADLVISNLKGKSRSRFARIVEFHVGQ